MSKIEKALETLGIEIPEGYEFVKIQKIGWHVHRTGADYSFFFKKLIQYKTPTDKDAKNRPIVEVRANDKEGWLTRELVAVCDDTINHRHFNCFSTTKAEIIGWEQCRMKVEG